jgi:hypothetical protein
MVTGCTLESQKPLPLFPPVSSSTATHNFGVSDFATPHSLLLFQTYIDPLTHTARHYIKLQLVSQPIGIFELSHPPSSSHQLPDPHTPLPLLVCTSTHTRIWIYSNHPSHFFSLFRSSLVLTFLMHFFRDNSSCHLAITADAIDWASTSSNEIP